MGGSLCGQKPSPPSSGSTNALKRSAPFCVARFGAEPALALRTVGRAAGELGEAPEVASTRPEVRQRRRVSLRTRASTTHALHRAQMPADLESASGGQQVRNRGEQHLCPSEQPPPTRARLRCDRASRIRPQSPAPRWPDRRRVAHSLLPTRGSPCGTELHAEWLQDAAAPRESS